ncbi:MAG: hypothetical protein V4724_39750 [Pseudomonadota bacterium]
MKLRHAIRALGRGMGYIAWPWSSIKRTLTHVRAAKDDHVRNIVYMRDLFGRSRSGIKRKSDGARADHGFHETMGNRPATAPSITELKRRYLFQKRLALGTGAAISIVSICAIASGHWLAMATILSSIPLLFMACLSAHFRLWQLRHSRLSKEEHGGLDDFFQENRNWIRQVLNPELHTKSGE